MKHLFRPSDILFIFVVGLFLSLSLHLNNLKDTHKEFIYAELGEEIWIEEAGENKLFGSFTYNAYLSKNGSFGKKQTFVLEGKEFVGGK